MKNYSLLATQTDPNSYRKTLTIPRPLSWTYVPSKLDLSGFCRLDSEEIVRPHQHKGGAHLRFKSPRTLYHQKMQTRYNFHKATTAPPRISVPKREEDQLSGAGRTDLQTSTIRKFGLDMKSEIEEDELDHRLLHQNPILVTARSRTSLTDRCLI
ncbi:hypothetical protein V6N13_050491 [Hibiscus sabdariffa]